MGHVADLASHGCSRIAQNMVRETIHWLVIDAAATRKHDAKLAA